MAFNGNADCEIVLIFGINSPPKRNIGAPKLQYFGILFLSTSHLVPPHFAYRSRNLSNVNIYGRHISRLPRDINVSERRGRRPHISLSGRQRLSDVSIYRASGTRSPIRLSERQRYRTYARHLGSSQGHCPPHCKAYRDKENYLHFL